jgi:lysozyme
MGIKDYIKKNEGLRLRPYLCAAGKLTIGYGRNLEDLGISEREAELLLENDISRCFDELCDIFGGDAVYELTYRRTMGLVDMIFNLGKTRFLSFERMIQAVKDRDFDRAADEIIDSLYYRKDTTHRAQINAELVRSG